MKFACDSVMVDGDIVDCVGTIVVLQGTHRDAGFFFTRNGAEVKRHNSLADAQLVTAWDAVLASDDKSRVSELKVHLKELSDRLPGTSGAERAKIQADMKDVRAQIEKEGGWFAKDGTGQDETLTQAQGDKFRSEGESAAKNKKPRSDNPYKEGSAAAKEWARGYNQFGQDTSAMDADKKFTTGKIIKLNDGTNVKVLDVEPNGKRATVIEWKDGKAIHFAFKVTINEIAMDVIDYPKIDFNKLITEHQKEAQRKGAKITNLAWGQDVDGIASKTDHGILESTISKSGAISHKWSRSARDAAPAMDAKKVEVEFDGHSGKVQIPSFTDSAIEAAAKHLKLWDGKSDRFPSFTVYEDGQEVGGG